ncbi:MAG: 3-deoxy-D-manno-octulosonic acid transferase [Methyloprofundus sp.]|nr:3-deoxy-D-manno-octulosonic acid transferase [Methyloprofundus sp.]
MYYFYVTLFYLLLPFLMIFYFIKGRKNKAYQARWKEYLGFYSVKHTQQVIWVHAASVGEVEAANVLINYFRDHSAYKVLVTTNTEPGYQRVVALQGDAVEHVYLPLDAPDAIQRFFSHFQPRLAIIMETEIWPVLFTLCAKKSIPLFIVNARLSEKSAQGYLKLRFFLQSVFAEISGVIVQTEVDAHRYQQIGVSEEKITVSGNIKLDMLIPESMKQQGMQIKRELFPERLAFVVGSTHQGEEALFLNVYQHLKQQFPELLLILVPRQPRRADEIAQLCLAERLNIVRRTENKPCTASIDVFLVDTIGELKQMYAVADCSFVAGSMIPIGGHNIFEPILLDVPVLFGPYMKNSELLAQQVLAAKGAIQCFDEADIVNAVALILSQAGEKDRLVKAGRAFVEQNKGALERTVAVIQRSCARTNPDINLTDSCRL